MECYSAMERNELWMHTHGWISKIIGWVKEARHGYYFSIFPLLWSSRTNLWNCNPAWWSFWVWEGGTLLRHMKELSRVKAMLLLDWMLVPWIHTLLNTHQRVHLRSTHFAICNYTSIKIRKLHTLITPQQLWIFSWFIKWGVQSNMHFDCIMNMKHADYQFIFLWKPRDRAKTTLCDRKMDLPILQHFQFSISCLLPW